MQAVILAGGKGERLRPITNNTPKPFVSINGKPFIQYQLEALKRAELNEVLILLGYLGERIENYFGDGSKYGLKIKYSHEKSLLGTAGGLKNAQDKLADEFLVLNGDTYLDMDYNLLIKKFYSYKKLGILTLYTNRGSLMKNNVSIDSFNFITAHNKKAPKNMTHVDAGVMVFKKDILDYIPEGEVYSLEGDLYKDLIAKKELVAFPIGQRFYDMGSKEGLKEIEKVLH